jgi:formate-dependent nitrite reductase cytochrome c552 subunit
MMMQREMQQRDHFWVPFNSYLVAGSLARAMADFHPLASSCRSVYSPVDATVMLAWGDSPNVSAMVSVFFGLACGGV